MVIAFHTWKSYYPLMQRNLDWIPHRRPSTQGASMFEYFPDYYPWSLAVCCSLGMRGEISEIDEACRALRGLPQTASVKVANENWSQNWTKLGEKLDALAHADLKLGNRLTASDKFMRAANYLLFAERMMSWSDTRRLQIYRKAQASFKAGVECSGARAERIEVPFQDATLSGWLTLPKSSGRHPCIIFYNGFDSIKEMHYQLYADTAVERGIAVLFVDQEGTGEAVRFHALIRQPETEVSAGAFVDFLEKHPAIDTQRIGIAGISMGGYCAPRAAAYEKRLKCAMSLGAYYKLEDSTAQRMLGAHATAGGAESLPEEAEHAMKISGGKTPAEAVSLLRRWDLGKALPDLTCPLLVVHGENDRQVPLAHAQRTVAEAIHSSNAELRVFTLSEGSAEHCGADVMAPQGQYLFDWAARTLGVARSAA
jgi:dienelactone hydrolase